MNDAQLTEAVAQLAGVLWVLALLILLVASHVLLGYMRNAVRATTALARVTCAAAAALSFGTTVWGAMALGIGSEGLQYPVGFAPAVLFVAWIVACGVTALALLLLLRWTHGAALAAGGTVIALGIFATRLLMLQGIDPRPGIDWSYAALTVSALVGIAGSIAGCWIGLRQGSRGRLRRSWRWTAALAISITALAAQELALAAATLQTQKASMQSHQVPLAAICVFAALALPIVLALLQLDLYRRTVLFEGEKREERRARRRQRKQEAQA